MHTSSRFVALALVTGFAVGLYGLSSVAMGQEKQGEKIDDAAIARLIEKLGSSQFKERDAADKALERIGHPAMEALRKAAKSADAEVANRAARLVAILENSLEQFLVEYQAYGLPLPPKDAKLVKFWSGGVGILIQSATKDDGPVLLIGTEELRLHFDTKAEIIEPTVDVVKIFDGNSWFRHRQLLAFALQCKSRGWEELALQLWAERAKARPGEDVQQPLRIALKQLAWDYYIRELVKPKSDRSIAAKHMKSLMATLPELDTAANQRLLESLQAALVPSTAKPGSFQRLVDDLVDYCSAEDQRDSRYERLANKGFDAVPTLIEHLDDNRLTRKMMEGFNNFRSWNMRVKHVVSDLVKEIAGDDLGKDWLDRQVGRAVEKADAEAWWKKASKEGEEAYFVAHVLPSGEKQGWPNALMLEIIAEKYSGHLPKLYKTLLDERPKIESWPIAEQVNKSKLSADDKRKVFLYAANHDDLKHRRFGLEYLESYEPEEFMRILLATMESIPKTPTEPYWQCPEIGIVYVVLGTTNPTIWDTLGKVAKRSDVGLRMEFIDRFNTYTVNDKNRQLCLKFLAAFLEDTAAPDKKANPKMFDGPHAGFTFKRLSVQDLAAWQIARILKMPERPDRDWTAEQWEKLRAKVKKALEK